jgi:hypothetical protein
VKTPEVLECSWVEPPDPFIEAICRAFEVPVGIVHATRNLSFGPIVIKCDGKVIDTVRGVWT